LSNQLRLKEDDRGIFFLARTNDAPGWYVLGPEGLYLIDGAGLVDTRPVGPAGTQGRVDDRGPA